jgi:hypothetical protein
MNMDADVKQPGPSTEQPWARMLRQAKDLDNALATIPGYTDESERVRLYLVGQIEALRWAAKLYDVG